MRLWPDLLAPQGIIIDSGFGPRRARRAAAVRFAVFLLRSPEARRGHDAAAVTVPPLKFNVRQSSAPRVGPMRQWKRKRQRLGESTVPAKRLRAERPNHVWALDFQFDTTSDGRTLKLLHVVDEYTREALAMRVARSIDADHTTRVLDRRPRARRRPGARPDGQRPPDDRQRPARPVPLQRAQRSFIEPGSPWQNPFVESFGSRVRDEVLSVEAFDSVIEAQTVINDWKDITTTNGRTAATAGETPPPSPQQ
jgi:putative transposase